MTGFKGLWDIKSVEDAGRVHFSSFRKTPSVATTGAIWFDFSMSPGNPNPQYYAAAPLVAQQMKRSTDGGINHGQITTGFDKYITNVGILTSSATGQPMPWILCDYLLFYPFIDTGTNDEQFMTNSVSLPRCVSGEGVMMMAVSVASGSGLRPSFIVNYTNSSGTSGRISQTMTLNSAVTNGSIVTSTNETDVGSGVFIGLQSGDSGVRSVQSVTFTSGTDVGLFALVLVKPLISSGLLEQTAPCELDRIEEMMWPKQIEQDAFLSFVSCPAGSLSGVSFHGYLETMWN